MSTLDAKSTQNIWENLQDYCTACGKLLLGLLQKTATQTYFHCVAAWVKVNGSHKISGKKNVGAERDVAFGLLVCCGHCICLGLLSIRVCGTWTMLVANC